MPKGRPTWDEGAEPPGAPMACTRCGAPVRGIRTSPHPHEGPIMIEERKVAGMSVGDLMPRAVWPYHRC